MEKDLDFDEEDFVESEINENHLKGAVIALLVIAAICSLIIFSIFLLSPSTNLDDIRVDKYEINDILDFEFKPQLFNGTWISGHQFVYKELNGSIVLFDAKSESISSILVQNYITSRFEIQRFSLSTDRGFVLLISEYKKTLDFQLIANYYIFNIKNGSIIKLETLIEKDSKILVQWADWAPVGNALVFINKNDIYYMPHIGAKVRTITSSGKEGIVFNGIPDLLYKEQISSKDSMLWWTKDGSCLCYATIDNSGVADNTIVFYGKVDNNNNSESDSLKFVKYKYPKAQQLIPKISLWVYNLSSGLVKQLSPPTSLVNKDFYVTFVNWITNNSLTVVWTLKNQSNSIISTCFERQDWMCDETIKISSALSLKQFSQNIVSSNDGMTYFMISLRPDKKIGSYYQIISFRLDETFIESFLTYQAYDVTKLIFYDELTHSLYFEAKESIIVEKQDIYRVNIKNKTIDCISCQLPFTDCHYFEAFFSPTAEYYIVQCLGPNIPKVYSLKFRETKNCESFMIFCKSDDKLKQLSTKVFELESNEVLENKLQTIVELKHQIFAVISNNKKIYIKLLLPLEFDDEVIAKYPLIIEAHNPGNRVLTNKWTVGWSQYWVSKHNFIYCWVESDDQDIRHIKQNYELINENIENYIIAINHIKDNLLYIDSKRMCIWGSNVGAFVAISSLAATDAIDCAILISPVLNFKLMDVVTFDHLFKGLNSLPESFDITNKISKLMSKNILIIHGSADEKVPVQHSMLFIKQIVSEYSRNGWNSFQPLTQLQLYPDADNSLNTIRHHMYQRIHTFLEQIFCQTSRKHDIKST